METFGGQRETEASQLLFFCAAITGYLQASDLIVIVKIKQVLNKLALHIPHISCYQKSDAQFSIRKKSSPGRQGWHPVVKLLCTISAVVLFRCSLSLFPDRPSSLGVEFVPGQGHCFILFIDSSLF